MADSDPARRVGAWSGPEAEELDGERLEADLALVVAPLTGVFEEGQMLRYGCHIQAGDVIGRIRNSGSWHDVHSGVSGRVVEHLVSSGQKVRHRDPLISLAVRNPGGT